MKIEQAMALYVNQRVGQASRLPAAAKPPADMLSRSRESTRGAGGTPALLWSQSA